MKAIVSIEIGDLRVRGEFSTAQEAAEFCRALGVRPPGRVPQRRRRARSATPGADHPTPPPIKDGQIAEAVKVLETLYGSTVEENYDAMGEPIPPSGFVSADELTASLGLKDSKGLSGPSRNLRKLLKVSGLEWDDVVIYDREPGVGRIWRAGPKIEEAISAIRGTGVKRRQVRKVSEIDPDELPF